jgi:hypothetical protein
VFYDDVQAIQGSKAYHEAAKSFLRGLEGGDVRVPIFFDTATNERWTGSLILLENSRLWLHDSEELCGIHPNALEVHGRSTDWTLSSWPAVSWNGRRFSRLIVPRTQTFDFTPKVHPKIQ